MPQERRARTELTCGIPRPGSWRAGSRGVLPTAPSPGVAHRRSFEREPVCVMEDAVANSIRDTRFADGRMPRGGGQLARDERRATFAAIFDDLQQIPSFGLGQRREQ